MRTRLAALGLLLACTACHVFTLGGPGHGTRFVVPPGAFLNPDPVVQSWIAYSFARSACQLEYGGNRPSHHDSFECELRSREVLVQRWAALSQLDVTDSENAAQRDYLDLLLRVERAGFLAEYVWAYLERRDAAAAAALQLDAFDAWQAQSLGWHRPRTRIIGWWTEP